MKSQNRYFTLIELMIALGVIVVAACGLMALFTIGASYTAESRDAFYADLALKNILNYVEFNVTQYWGKEGGLKYNIKPDDVPTKGDREGIASPVNSCAGWHDLHYGWDFFPKGMAYVRNNSNKDYTYLVNFTHTIYEDDGISYENSDFYGIVTLWKENLSKMDRIGDEAETEANVGLRICAEVSWPANVEESERYKRQAYVDVLKCKSGNGE